MNLFCSYGIKIKRGYVDINLQKPSLKNVIMKANLFCLPVIRSLFIIEIVEVLNIYHIYIYI